MKKYALNLAAAALALALSFVSCGGGGSNNNGGNGPAVAGEWAAVAVGNTHTVALKADGSLWAWGNNYGGELGLGDYNDRSLPTRVGTASDWKAVSAGWFHSLAIKSDGSLWTWGSNRSGELGLGDYNNRNVPTRVGTASDWKAVSANNSYAMALKMDGSLWVLGWNLDGYDYLFGDYNNRNVPTRVGTASDWAAVSAGIGHVLAIKADGSLWAWGNNSSGELGLGNSGQNTGRYVPTRVGTASDWKAVSAKYAQSLAIKTDGSLWAWGENYDGQLGLGDDKARNVPTRVGTASDWKAVAASGGHSLAIKTDGSLWTWGNNLIGQLCLGDTNNRYVPTRLGTASDWKAVAVDLSPTAIMAIKSDGSLWAWGSNSDGQLGLGDNINALVTVPTRVGGAR